MRQGLKLQASCGEGCCGQEYTGLGAEVFSFRPNLLDMSVEPHLPAIYRGVTTTGKLGTRNVDVWRRNPRVGYKVTAILNGQQVGTVEIRMDEIDVIRQEYINHIKSADTDGDGIVKSDNVGPLVVLERDEFIRKDSITSVIPGDWSQAEGYVLMREKHMSLLATTVKSGFSQQAAVILAPFSGTNISLDSGQVLSPQLYINSGWRNPERNERVKGAATSNHMLGRALDIGTRSRVDTTARVKLMWVLWRTATLLPANDSRGLDFRWLLEDADGAPNGKKPNDYNTDKLVQAGDTNRYTTRTDVPLDDNRGESEFDLPDGIPDFYNWASHLHVETFGESSP